MTGFELQTSGVGSDHSTNWATITAHVVWMDLCLNVSKVSGLVTYCAFHTEGFCAKEKKVPITWAKFCGKIANFILAILQVAVFNTMTHCCCCWSVWQYLANFRPFGKTLKYFGNIFRHYLVLGILLNLLRQIWSAIGQIFNAVNSEILKNNLAIWSHCCCSCYRD